jgi:hypothetical protein
MSAVLYPIAINAEAALSAPLGRAARQSEAVLVAGAEVLFVTEAVGPGFVSRDAALGAYAGRVDDERPGGGASIAPEDRYCQLRELSAARPPRPGKGRPVRPVYRDGRRWPAPPPSPETLWRLSISYWRVVPARVEPLPSPPDTPRARGNAAAKLDAQTLRARIGEPLRPLKPQQPLDIGLFEVRPPEAPHILMPDE